MTEKRKAVLLIMDGLGDRIVDELDGRTPLQAAKTPTLDRLAKEGQSGLLDVIGPGITPGSDAAHLALFGYDPIECYSGRGPLEALGAGLASKPGDVAFRANFGTVDTSLVVTDRRAGRAFSPEEHTALEKALSGIEIDGVKVHFVATVEHRGAVVLEGKGLSGEVTEIDPHETGLRVLESKPMEPDAKITADVVNKLVRLSYERLRDLEVNKEREKRGLPPANILLLRGPGQHREIPTLQRQYGIKSAVIAGGSLYIGTAKYVGMEHITVEGQTGTIDTNFDNIAAKSIETINSDYNYVFIHIKATDNASHDGDSKQKVLAIERTDKMLAKIVKAVGHKIVIAVTGDHSTPLSVGEHTSDPVPIVLWSNFIRPDNVRAFSEIDAADGALHTIQGTDVMSLLLGYAGYIDKLGA
jgi:2,3-bisphosphoglycerate-independent phosphoglycerate mutase